MAVKSHVLFILRIVFREDLKHRELIRGIVRTGTELHGVSHHLDDSGAVDLDLRLGAVATIGSHGAELIDDVHALGDLAKHSVLAVQVTKRV